MNFLNKKAIIFDMDGTLIDSMYAWDNLAYRFLVNRNIQPPSNLKDIVEKKTLEEAGKYFITEYKLDLSVREIVEEFYGLVIGEYKDNIKLKPYVKEFLEEMKSRDIKMCVLTASERVLGQLAFKRLGIYDYFEFIMTETEENLSKRDKDIYLKAAEKLDVGISETIVFEDAIHCVTSAKKAGFTVVSVYDKYFDTLEKDIKKISDIHIRSYKELL